MSTYANIQIEGREFHIISGGGDWETIRDCVRDYVAEIKGKVKPEYLITAVLDAITAEAATDYYAAFNLGYIDFPSYRWEMEIGPRGGVKIRRRRD